jgi:tetratricopeptide (TPR) repeat protein
MLVCLCLVAPLARAAPDARAHARQQFKVGSQHYNLGEYQPALEAFKEAYRSLEDPIFLYNIAQCQRQLGQKREAVRAYRAYLNNSGDAPNREQVQQLIRQLDGDIAAEDARQAEAAAAAAAAAAATPVATPLAAPAVNAPVLVASAPAPKKTTPAYRKWWVWTLAGVGAAGLATGLAVGLSGPRSPAASTTLGTYNPGF